MAPLDRTRHGGVEVLRLARPEARNALDTASLTAVLDALDELSQDVDLRVLVFSTTDTKALCAGADVQEDLDHEGGVRRMELFARFYAAVEAFPAPTIAVCVGNVVGAGAELAAGCDLRIGGDNLKLAWPGAKLGVPVGPARLVPLVGLAKAKELILTGRVVGADEAHQLGLLHQTTAAGAAEQAAIDLANEIARHPPDGLRRLKRMFRELGLADERVAYENGHLIEFQRAGAGLPRRTR